MGEIDFHLNGRRMHLTRQRVIESMQGVDESEPLQTWTVEIEGRLFPVKQAFAAATGQDRTAFTSHRARDVLDRLGFRIGKLEHSEAISGGPADNARAATVPSGGTDAIQTRLAILPIAVQLMGHRAEPRMAEVLELAETLEAWVTR